VVKCLTNLDEWCENLLKKNYRTLLSEEKSDFVFGE